MRIIVFGSWIWSVQFRTSFDAKGNGLTPLLYPHITQGCALQTALKTAAYGFNCFEDIIVVSRLKLLKINDLHNGWDVHKMKNSDLAKKSVPAASNSDTITFRLPTGMIQQVKEMAAEQGLSSNAMAQKFIEMGMMRESVVDLVRSLDRKVADMNYNTDKYAQVLGDIATGIDDVKKMVGSK
jgi:predicted DNA binding CopG/RHH family protein